MIKLERNYTPILLTPSFVITQTAVFASTGEAVWNIEWLKESLLNIGLNKCCYCECDIKEESKYMEVEHFEDKNHYPSKVLDWENLLPSCKRCNGSKSNHDVIKYPIVNPFIIEPTKHLQFKLYRIRKKDVIGQNTIDAVNLNHIERAVNKRFEVGQGLEELIDTALERLKLYKENNLTVRRNKLLNIVEKTLKECQSNSIYSATCSTILHSNDDYQEIRDEMITLKLWDSTFENLHLLSKKLSLE
jgi:hypothetical protein